MGSVWGSSAARLGYGLVAAGQLGNHARHGTSRRVPENRLIFPRRRGSRTYGAGVSRGNSSRSEVADAQSCRPIDGGVHGSVSHRPSHREAYMPDI